MAKLQRKFLRLFGINGSTSNFGVFGSLQNDGVGTENKDITTVQSLDNWLTGISACLLNLKAAPYPEINSLLYVYAYMLCTIFEEGIPEWQTDTAYFIGSVVKDEGNFDLYGSLVDNNVGNALPNQATDSNWQYLGNLASLSGDGWVPVSETWTYASASSFVISGDQTGKYQKDQRIRLVQATTKYFTIIKVSFSLGVTTVNIDGGSLYSLANAAVISPYYSTQVAPIGLPTNWRSFDAVGDMKSRGSSNIPSGWLPCDGSEYSRTLYSDLFSEIGTTWGTGNGTTTFNVPDTRGIYPKGAGTTTRVAGVDASGNAYSATLGAYAQDKMQGHRHSNTNDANFLNAGNNLQGGAQITISPATITVGDPTTDGTNGTPRTGHTTEPQNLGVVFIIKY